MTVAGKLKGR